MMAWLQLLFGLVLLCFGAQALVKGGASLALRLGLTPLVIGLTVMAYGTSAPEAVVSVNASLMGNGAITLGNVVGSNICNIALVLGLAAMITPMATSVQMIRREIPLMIGVTVVFCLMLLDGQVARWEGAVLLLALVVYTVVTVRGARKEAAAAKEAAAEFEGEIDRSLTLGRAVVYVIVGLLLLTGGAQAFVKGAVTLARWWGVEEIIIGLTVVAVGTSLPELAASVTAAIKKHADVAVGNIVGSNLFNLLGIVGLAAVLRPIESTGLRWGDLLMMLGLSVVLLPLAKSGGRISRWEGAFLLASFCGYSVWLVSRELSVI